MEQGRTAGDVRPAIIIIMKLNIVELERDMLLLEIGGTWPIKFTRSAVLAVRIGSDRSQVNKAEVTIDDKEGWRVVEWK